MTLDEQGALFAERHSAHLQIMTGSMSAQVLDLLARLDTANAHARSLEDENKALTTQRDAALHMQAETMKTVEQSGEEIERLKAEVERQTKGREAILAEFQEYAALHDPDPVERARFTEVPPGPYKRPRKPKT